MDPFEGMRMNMAGIIGADPWNRKPHQQNLFAHSSINLSFELKRAALRASASVVGIISYLGVAKTLHASGFVIESVAKSGKFVSTILTTASIFRPEDHINAKADSIKISVMLLDGRTCKGRISGYDFHYNIGVIKIKTFAPLATATLRHIDDSISIDPNLLDEIPPKFHPESGKFNLVPGDTVVALGRYHAGIEHSGHGLMVIAGKYSVKVIELDCKELFRAELEIWRHGIGGPLINCYGEVIGINFYYSSFTPFLFTPFLPINIVSLWWEQFKRKRYCLLPRLGVELDNLCMQQAGFLENVIQRFPNIFKGVVLCKVTPGCPAELLQNDIIVQCDGKFVGSILEFFELIWDKVGEPVQLHVLRPSEGSRRDVTMVVGNVGENQVNGWPLPVQKFRKLRCV